MQRWEEVGECGKVKLIFLPYNPCEWISGRMEEIIMKLQATHPREDIGGG